MTNNLKLAKCITWTNSGTSFIVDLQIFPESLMLLLCNDNVSFFSLNALLIWILYSYIHLITAVFGFRASVEYVRLPSHQSGEFVALDSPCLSTSFLRLPPFRSLLPITGRTKPGNSPTPSSYVAAQTCSMRSS